MRRERVGESRRIGNCEAKSEDVSAETSHCADPGRNPIVLSLRDDDIGLAVWSISDRDARRF